MIAKPTFQQCIDIVETCISHLSENCCHEKGLFRIAPPMDDVRRLKSAMCEGNIYRLSTGALIDTDITRSAPIHTRLRFPCGCRSAAQYTERYGAESSSRNQK